MPPERVMSIPENTRSTIAAKSAVIRGTHPHLQSTARKGALMPDKETIERAQKDKRQGKAPSTRAAHRA
jgi:hypothetical protein